MSRHKIARLEVVRSETREGLLSLRGSLGVSAQSAVTAGGFEQGDDTILLTAKVVEDTRDAVHRLHQWLGTSHDEDELMNLLTHLVAVTEPLR